MFKLKYTKNGGRWTLDLDTGRNWDGVISVLSGSGRLIAVCWFMPRTNNKLVTLFDKYPKGSVRCYYFFYPADSSPRLSESSASIVCIRSKWLT